MIGRKRSGVSSPFENILSGLLMVAAAMMAWWFWLSDGTTAGDRRPIIVDDWPAFAAGGQRLGPPDRPVTVVVFSDYECPYCLILWEAIDAALEDPDLGVNVFYRHYFNAENHRNAAGAAVAVECAARAGRFLEYHRLLFINQGALGGAPWVDLAIQAGVEDVAGFRQCVASEAVATRIVEDREAAERLGVRGTPTFLVNDEQWVGAMEATEFRMLLRRKLVELGR